MTYQVLARKWRPHTFEQLVGQAHVTQALTYALEHQKLHHAYLFSGTRGVGKTTIARILAKCLNCEKGISAHPCGACSICQEVDAGHFSDLIEVDAASRTRVEDTRELLDNIVYAPNKGRYKVYLIDEIHMLSGHSFNALLKTLEEPPSHVIFLLATTDPQKLPVTVLSRCLQFHLRSIPNPLLEKQMATVLTDERITFEGEALPVLAQAARGSLRDALSLLEQAIGVGQGQVTRLSVELMLGCTYQAVLPQLIAAIVERNTEDALASVNLLYENGTDFFTVLDALLAAFHAFAICKAVPEQEMAMAQFSGLSVDMIKCHANMMPEQIQLLYQICLKGKEDIEWAPNPKIGFEMVVLRLIHFKPFEMNRVTETRVVSAAPVKMSAPKPTRPQEEISQPQGAHPLWSEITPKLQVGGLAKVLVQNCVVTHWALPKIQLTLDAKQAVCLNEERRQKIEEALGQYLGEPVSLSIQSGDVKQSSPQALGVQKEERIKTRAEQLLQEDVMVQKLIKTFDATVEQVTLTEKND